MTYYSTETLTSVTPRNAVFHNGRWWPTSPGDEDRDAHLAEVGIVRLNDDAVRPADTETHTSDRSVELIVGVPTTVYSQRQWTEEELFAREQALVPDPLTVLRERLLTVHEVWTEEGRYLSNEIVLHPTTGDRYRNDLPTVNVWPLDNRHARWTNLDAVEPEGTQPWQEWTGFNEDLYQIDDEVTHVGKLWRSVQANNHWEPGVFGWEEVV